MTKNPHSSSSGTNEFVNVLSDFPRGIAMQRLISFALISASMIVPSGALAFLPPEFNLKASSEGSTLSIFIETHDIHASACQLSITRTAVTLPEPDSATTGEGLGRIDLTAEVTPDSHCVRFEGPHHGEFILTRTDANQDLPDGAYDLSVNGMVYGTILWTKGAQDFSAYFF